MKKKLVVAVVLTLLAYVYHAAYVVGPRTQYIICLSGINYEELLTHDRVSEQDIQVLAKQYFANRKIDDMVSRCGKDAHLKVNEFSAKRLRFTVSFTGLQRVAGQVVFEKNPAEGYSRGRFLFEGFEER